MTVRWWAVLTSSALVAGVALWLDWAALMAMSAAGIGLCALPYCLRLPRRATWQDLEVPVRVARADPASLEIEVDVPTGSSRWVSSVSPDGKQRDFLPGLAPPVTLSWLVDTGRRGEFLAGPVRLESGDPFGLVRHVLATRAPSKVLVVPRIRPVEAAAPRAAGDADNGEERAGSQAFQSLREYVPGDPQKLVHWRASAHAGTLMVRRMVDITVPWLLVILDVNARSYDRPGAMFPDFDAEAFEEAVDTAASWAWHGCGPGQRVMMLTTADPHEPAALGTVEVTARTREAALDALAVVQPLPPEHCSPAKVQALLRRRGISRAVYVTGCRRETSIAHETAWRRLVPISVVRSGS